MNPNHLPETLSLRDAFWFPVSTRQARKDIFVGGLLVLFLFIFGWILNLGNRLNVVGRLYRNEQPVFRGFEPWSYTFKRGCLSFAAIALYLSPTVFFGLLAVVLKYHDYERGHWIFAVFSVATFVLAVFTLPGGMTVFACEDDLTMLKNPRMAFRRAWAKKYTYGHAWIISLGAVSLSVFGLLVFGIGFVFTSVWSWEVVGYVFTVALYGGGK